MPNFNGAIIVHTLQLIKTPATVREIVTTIAKNTDLPQDELMKPVKQTLDMGHRLGFLQKLNGRYFLVPMTFDTLMAEMQAPGLSARTQETLTCSEEKQKPDKRVPKKTQKVDKSKKILLLNHFPTAFDHESTTTLMPSQPSHHTKPSGLMQTKLKRSQPTK